ncbi:hypothetical protein BCR39DRAFT_547537 [Naematelia encephala]|uniref:Uncharacterized protein n=1 Tax=Naematelia encephala TaxID=71784 RepID=A0A1Y2ANP8_9TREE|nr:hypothetical protein BCR39DRAFT_547537 [Naematelia encephala]
MTTRQAKEVARTTRRTNRLLPLFLRTMSEVEHDRSLVGSLNEYQYIFRADRLSVSVFVFLAFGGEVEIDS